MPTAGQDDPKVAATVLYTSDIPVSRSVTHVGCVLFNPGLPITGPVSV